MFCPRCGAPALAAPDASVVCQKTGISWSAEHLRELESYVVPPDVPRPASPLTCDPEGSWFCIDCGQAMLKSPGFVDCPTCGRSYDGHVNAWLGKDPHPVSASSPEAAS